MVEIGMLLPQPQKPPKEIIKSGKKIKDYGFDGIWTPDHIFFSGEGTASEAWTILNTIAREIETQKNIEIGSAVTDPHRYHPAVLAQRLATTTHLTQQKIVLGLGAGESMNLDPYGIKWNKPVTRMEESIDVISQLLNSSPDNPVYFDGDFFDLENASLQIQPNRSVPIYVAANGPRTRKITAKKADGWIPVHPPVELFEKHLQEIKNIASKHNRKLDNFKAAPQIPTVIADSKNDALEILTKFKYVIAWPQAVKEAGYNIDIPEELKGINYANISPQNKEEAEKLKKLSNLYPDEVCLDFSISGSPEDCIKRIEEYEKAGVDHIILLNFSRNFEESLEIYSEKILPHFR